MFSDIKFTKTNAKSVISTTSAKAMDHALSLKVTHHQTIPKSVASIKTLWNTSNLRGTVVFPSQHARRAIKWMLVMKHILVRVMKMNSIGNMQLLAGPSSLRLSFLLVLRLQLVLGFGETGLVNLVRLGWVNKVCFHPSLLHLLPLTLLIPPP